MKTPVRAALFAILLALLPTSLLADAAKGHDAAFLVRTPQHIKAAIKTGRETRAGHGFQTNRIAIVVCGKGVNALRKESELAPVLRKAMSEKVDIKACGMSLDNQKLRPAALLDGIKVVPNGLTEMLRLQAAGYLTVDL